VREIAAALRAGGRFAFTLEEGTPLTPAERAAMPDADTVRLTPLDEMTASLERAGLVVTSQEDRSRPHRAMAQALAGAFAADATEIAARIGRRALDELLAAHRLWVEWLDEGRVRKLALVAQLTAASPQSPPAPGARASDGYTRTARRSFARRARLMPDADRLVCSASHQLAGRAASSVAVPLAAKGTYRWLPMSIT
jgi:hypothetical protein